MQALPIKPRLRRVRYVLTAGLVLAALVPGEGFAQSTGPTQLVPSWMQAEGATPVEPRPAAEKALPKPEIKPPSPSAAPPREATRSASGPESIESHPLEEVDADAFGLLDASHGGLGAAMWQGTPREVVQRVLPRLPVHAPSHVLHDLTNRLLLSTAAQPVSAGKEGTTPLLPLRIERLLALGSLRPLQDMVAAMPVGSALDSVLRAKTESALIDGTVDAACADPGNKVRAPNDPFRQKYLVLCQAVAGEREAAYLGMDLLREQGHDDSVFHDIIWAMLGSQKLALKTLPDPSLLHIAALTAAKQPFPRDVLKSRSPAILRAIANASTGTVETRIEAAERAEAMGAFESEALRNIYRSIEFSDKEKADGKTSKGLDRGPRGRALLYQSALAETEPAAQAGAIVRAFEVAGSGLFLTMARLYQPQVEALKPSPDVIAYAETLGRALFAVNRADLAGGWLAMAREAAPRSDDAARAANALWPLARLAQARGSAPLDPAVLAGWRAAQGKMPPEKLAARTYALLNLLDAAGEPVSAMDWGDLLEENTVRTAKLPAGAAWNALAQASAAGRVGETVLFAVATLAGQDPGTADPVTLFHVISALRRAGLEREARALAVEAMLGSSP